MFEAPGGCGVQVTKPVAMAVSQCEGGRGTPQGRQVSRRADHLRGSARGLAKRELWAWLAEKSEADLGMGGAPGAWECGQVGTLIRSWAGLVQGEPAGRDSV